MKSRGCTMEKVRDLEKETEAKENESSPPDGGWGWVIVFAVFTGNCLMDGCVGSYGIFYPELLRAFDSGPVVTSLAGSLLPAVHMISSPLVGRINMKYGSRPVCFVGGCIGGIGLILASLSYNIATFMFTFGVILGIGISMNFLPGHVITNNYFEKKRGIAGGIVCSGAGFGIFILAPVLQLLLEEYGWRGTMLITAGIFMQLCACSTLLRPLYKKKKRPDKIVLNSKSQKDEYVPMINEVFTQKDTREKSYVVHLGSCVDPTETQHKINIEDQYLSQSSQHSFKRITVADRSASDNLLAVKRKLARQDHDINLAIKSLQDISLDKQNLQMKEFLRHSQFVHPVAVLAKSQQFFNDNEFSTNQSHESVQDIRNKSHLCKATPCDISMLTNKTFIPILLGGVLIQMGQFIPNMFIPEYCFSIGLDGTHMSAVMAIYGAVNIFGRLSAGCLANIERVDALWLCNMGMFVCGIGCVVFSFCTSFESLCIFAVGMGYFIGYFPPLQILVMVEYLGIDNLTSSLGILQMAKGPAALFGPPLAGLVYQYSQNYAMSIGFAGILFLLAAFIQSIVPLSNMCCTDKKAVKLDTDVEILVNQQDIVIK